jgi:hypothetical protein
MKEPGRTSASMKRMTLRLRPGSLLQQPANDAIGHWLLLAAEASEVILFSSCSGWHVHFCSNLRELCVPHALGLAELAHLRRMTPTLHRSLHAKNVMTYALLCFRVVTKLFLELPVRPAQSGTVLQKLPSCFVLHCRQADCLGIAPIVC